MAEYLFLNPLWKTAFDCLVEGKSVMVHAPRHFGKKYFHEYLLKEPDLNSLVHIINITLLSNDFDVDFKLVWRKITNQLNITNQSNVHNSSDFVEQVLDISKGRRLLFVVQSSELNTHSNVSLIDAFVEVFSHNLSSLLSNISMLVLDNYSLYYLENKLNRNSSGWDFFLRFSFKQLQDLEPVLDQLKLHSVNSGLKKPLAQLILDMTGGHEGLILELISFFNNYKEKLKKSECQQLASKHLLGCDLIDSIRKKILKIPNDLLVKVIKFRNKKIFENYEDEFIIDLHQSGILLKVVSTYSILCKGIISEMISNVIRSKASNIKTRPHQIKSKELNYQFDHGYALFIGIRYGYMARPLDGTLRDVDALVDHFTNSSKAAYNRRNIIALKETAATQSNILLELDKLVEKSAKDPEATVIVYYSGHGEHRNNNSYLLPYDYKEQGLLSGRIFAEKIARITAKKCLIILDCCHSENIAVEKNSGHAGAFLDTLVSQLDKTLDQQPVEKTLRNHNIKNGGGRVILTSCQSAETSLDLGVNSLFTGVLLESLRGEKNIEQDGWVRLIDLIRYVPTNVAVRAREKYDHSQNPMFKRIENLTAEDFIICAYDTAKIKAIENELFTPVAEKPDTKSKITQVDDLLTQGDFVAAFDTLDDMKIKKQFEYQRFKSEFLAGLQGIHLNDFVGRLRLFIRNL